MPSAPEDTAHGQVLAPYREHLQAMTEGDTDTLNDLLDDGFTLTHITGYKQPKAEWLAQMRAGQFDYHRVEERGAEVTVDGTAAHLVARIITDATVYGTRADWRLRLAMDYARQDQGWIALRSIATTW